MILDLLTSLHPFEGPIKLSDALKASYARSERVRIPDELSRIWIVSQESPPRKLLLETFQLEELTQADGTISFKTISRRASDTEPLREAIRATLEEARKTSKAGSLEFLLARQEPNAFAFRFGASTFGILKRKPGPGWKELADRFKVPTRDENIPWDENWQIAYRLSTSYDSLDGDLFLFDSRRKLVAAQTIQWPLSAPKSTVRLDLDAYDPDLWNIWKRIEMGAWQFRETSDIEAMKQRYGAEKIKAVVSEIPSQPFAKRWLSSPKTLLVLSDDWWRLMPPVGPGKLSYPTGDAATNEARIEKSTLGGWTVLRPAWRTMEHSAWPMPSWKQVDGLFDVAEVAKWLARDGATGPITYPELSALSRASLLSGAVYANQATQTPITRMLGTFEKPLQSRDWSPIGSLAPSAREALQLALASTGESESEDTTRRIPLLLGGEEFARGVFNVARGKGERLLFEDGLTFTGFPGSAKEAFHLDAVSIYVGDWLAKQSRLPTRESVEQKLRVSIHSVDVTQVQVRFANGETAACEVATSGMHPAAPSFGPFSQIEKERRDAFWRYALMAMRTALRSNGAKP